MRAAPSDMIWFTLSLAEEEIECTEVKRSSWFQTASLTAPCPLSLEAWPTSVTLH